MLLALEEEIPLLRSFIRLFRTTLPGFTTKISLPARPSLLSSMFSGSMAAVSWSTGMLSSHFLLMQLIPWHSFRYVPICYISSQIPEIDSHEQIHRRAALWGIRLQ